MGLCDSLMKYLSSSYITKVYCKHISSRNFGVLCGNAPTLKTANYAYYVYPSRVLFLVFVMSFTNANNNLAEGSMANMGRQILCATE